MAQAAVVAASRRQVEATRGSLTTAQANLVNPAIRTSQVAAVQGQILQAEADLAALGELLLKQKQFEEAAALFRRALAQQIAHQPVERLISAIPDIVIIAAEHSDAKLG